MSIIKWRLFGLAWLKASVSKKAKVPALDLKVEDQRNFTITHQRRVTYRHLIGRLWLIDEVGAWEWGDVKLKPGNF